MEKEICRKLGIDEIRSKISLHSAAEFGIITNPDFAEQSENLIPEKLRNRTPQYHDKQIKKLRKMLPPKPTG